MKESIFIICKKSLQRIFSKAIDTEFTFFKSFRNSLKFFRLGWNDRSWDFEYLLRLEKFKLQQMYKYFSESNISSDNWKTARDLKLAVSLLDIISEDDSSYEVCPDDPCVGNSLVYVNTRNAGRFYPANHTLGWFGNGNKSLILEAKDELRQEKAWRLYCRLRKDNLRTWWD